MTLAQIMACYNTEYPAPTTRQHEETGTVEDLLMLQRMPYNG